jgi:phospholipid-binding lipoprotein MlaA
MAIEQRFPSTAVFALIAVLMLGMIGGCASTSDPAEPAVMQTETESEQPGNELAVHDPWQETNRGLYNWNASIDRHVFIPIVDAYTFLVPEVLRNSISNVFTNLGNLTTFANQVLQLKFVEAGQTGQRFILNTGFGLLGIADVATAFEVPQYKEDFGQTLGYWGAGDGPYVVLPLLGPSNVRDTTGTATDTVAFSVIDPFGTSSIQTKYPPIFATNVVDARYKQPFRYYSTGSPFEYELVRMFYTQKRKFEIER